MISWLVQGQLTLLPIPVSENTRASVVYRVFRIGLTVFSCGLLLPRVPPVRSYISHFSYLNLACEVVKFPALCEVPVFWDVTSCNWYTVTDVPEYRSAVEMSVNSLPPDMAKVPGDLNL